MISSGGSNPTGKRAESSNRYLFKLVVDETDIFRLLDDAGDPRFFGVAEQPVVVVICHRRCRYRCRSRKAADLSLKQELNGELLSWTDETDVSDSGTIVRNK